MKNLNQSMRIMLTPVLILFLILGFFLKPHLLYWGMAVVIFAFDFFVYSSRIQRIRYWFEGYKKYLINNGGNEKEAIKSLLSNFRRSKYYSEVDSNEYSEINSLITVIIMKEFKFDRYLQLNGHVKFLKLSSVLQKEIEFIKNKVLKGLQ